jgi:hypothetical protein
MCQVTGYADIVQAPDFPAGPFVGLQDPDPESPGSEPDGSSEPGNSRSYDNNLFRHN